jgi:hypothetical protein
MLYICIIKLEAIFMLIASQFAFPVSILYKMVQEDSLLYYLMALGALGLSKIWS